jgi:hypothetical protein
MLDLQPARATSIALVRTARPLRDDAFEVAPARLVVQLDTDAQHVIQIQDARFDFREHPDEMALALKER